MSQITDLTVPAPGMWRITATHDGHEDTRDWGSEPPPDHTPESWLESRLHEACLLVEAQVAARQPAARQALTIPREFTTDTTRTRTRTTSGDTTTRTR